MRPTSSPSKEPLAIAVYRSIKDAIVTCELAPGSVVVERELASRHGVSKTPVREALNRLREEGLVRTVPHKGTMISPITIQDVQDTYYLRLLLEPEAAVLASQRASETQVRGLRELYERMTAVSPARVRARQFRRNTEFHLAVAEASGNPKLASAMYSLLTDVERFSNANHARGGMRPCTQWDTLVDAIAAGDADLARNVTIEGIRFSRLQLVEVLMKEPDHTSQVSL